MDDFSVTFGNARTLAFADPFEVVRADSAAGLDAALDRCQAALDAGAWIAGFIAYSGEAALGVFGAPKTSDLPDPAGVTHAPLLATAERDAYDAAIAHLQRAIYEGYVYQVNYTLPFDLAYQGDPLDFYAYYARRSGAGYQAYVRDGNRAIASWSPELFLEFDGRRLRTKPMKGTAALDRIDELGTPKNRAEHVMIVDLLRNDLHRICDDVTVERFLEIERYPTYATMTSTIAGTPRAGTSLARIFAAVFPCGSITGAPKRAAMRFIAETEVAPRGAYCGTIGYLSPECKGWWNVAIRTAQLDASTGFGRYDTGGGIVADSQASAEWAEILLKSRFLRPAAPFAVLETFASDADDATLALHLTRLSRSAHAFGIPYRQASVASAVLSQRSESKGQGDRVVRIRLQLDGTVEVRTEAANTPPEPLRVCFSGARVRSDDPFLRHKTSWRPAHDEAFVEARERDCFDAMLINERGEVTEGARTNLFVERDGALWTPSASSGVLPGVLRAHLLRDGRAREAELTVPDVRAAQTVYVGNSARGLLRATVVD
ncbi:MAG TPA: chorismate-binding protein [Candidatus Baltobacteraceae bacterium]|jgi:para-aminobenzoate synthetase/4-amino-4-deoxychorismate lyase|nr:chorismate-binding protein [Candidatus Baltobacteraceae bacterium]